MARIIENNPPRSMMEGVREFFRGLGYGYNLRSDNMGNPPGRPPLQVGSYQFIIPQMFASQRLLNIDPTPRKFQDWGQFGIQRSGVSGIIGGGSTAGTPRVDPIPTATVDGITGEYDFNWQKDWETGDGTWE
jgi:hypothetical protein